MSAIFEYRERVVEFLRENVPELLDVDWYDGLFDEEDVRSWSLRSPCAFVAVTNARADDYETGQSTIPVDMAVVIVCHDRREPRDADKTCWIVLEKMAKLFRQQTFGDPNAGVAHTRKFRRLKDPELRRDAVALGVVTWCANLTVGENTAENRDLMFDIYGNKIPLGPRLVANFEMPGDEGPSDVILSDHDVTRIDPPRLFRDTPMDFP